MMAKVLRPVALVTGASRNIGRAIAVRLARAGCDLVIHVGQNLSAGEETAEAVRNEGAKAVVVAADLTRQTAIVDMVHTAANALGQLDIIVNNAAIRPEAPFAELPLADWRAVMAVCLDAPFLIAQAALPYLEKSDRARIINIGGLTGHTGAENRAHVVTAKAGLVGLTRAMAHELAERGICVNCVSPGLIDTARSLDTHMPVHHAKRRNLLGHRGEPADVAEAVAYLCGSGAHYITGQTLHVNGGAFLP